MLNLIFWIFVVPAAIATLVAIRRGQKLSEYIESALTTSVDSLGPISKESKIAFQQFSPPATLIVPVRGVEHNLSQNLLSLASLNYPDYELIVVARSADDPGFQNAQTILGEKAIFVVGGRPSSGIGEKVNNLLAAVKKVRPQSVILAFADSDGQVTSDWLRNLVQPLEDDNLGATTGFRWYFPESGGFWPLLRSAWDSTITGNINTRDRNFAWGGAMALRHSTFLRLKISQYWKNTVSDDYRLSNALADAGLGIRFVPGAMVATTGSCGAKEFLSWACRQLIITRVYRPKMWVAGFAAHALYCAAIIISALMAMTENSLLGLSALVVVIIPGMAKGALRATAARLMFPERTDWFDQNDWAYFWLVPLCTWIWLSSFICSSLTRKIEWRGYVYNLVSADITTVVKSPK